MSQPHSGILALLPGPGRTFALITILGAICALLAAIIVAGNMALLKQRSADPGLTTEVAILLLCGHFTRHNKLLIASTFLNRVYCAISMHRRTFLSLSAAAATATAAWAHYVEPKYFELTHTRIRLAKARPRRILHISDIHMSDGMDAADLETGFRYGLSKKPDLICLTGDFVSDTRGFDRQGLLRLLRSAVATAPTYAVLGNHDGGEWLARWGGSRSTEFMQDLIGSAGVCLLHNQSAAVEDLTLVGVADYWSGEFAPEQAFASAPRTAATVLLCHNPDAKRDVQGLPWDLMLSGHTHGGQVHVPGISPLWTPVADKRFIAGLYKWENRQLFITRGIGSPRHVRAFCRPEISVLDLV